MKIYYDKDMDLEIQRQNILIKLNNNLDIQKGNLRILIQCLLNLNDIIQNIKQLEILNKLSILLKNLKNNLDITRNTISTLENLKEKLEILNLIDLSDKKNIEAIENYNKLISKFEMILYKSISNNSSFILDYIKNIEPIFYTSLYNNSQTELIENIENKIENNLISKKLEDNKTLLISEIQNKVFLPYSISDLNKKLKKNNSYNSIEEIINNEYIIPIDKYRNSIIARFKETFNLMRKKENASITDSLDLSLELAFNNLLNPAIITACKNLDELDIYLDCLNSNELNKFNLFEIKYEILPKVKHKKS